VLYVITSISLMRVGEMDGEICVTLLLRFCCEPEASIGATILSPR
jgi:hypothetical protein